MNPHSNDIPTDKVDAKSLATLIIELNIARRNSSAYPKGHPIIAASLSKVLSVYDKLLNIHDELIMGVTSDALMLDGVVLEKSNLVYRDFSRVLFERGIGALLFHKGLTIEELKKFTIILGLKRDQIQQHGGIELVWTKARIAAISIRPIRYDLLQTTDEDYVTTGCAHGSEEGLWNRFARALSIGELRNGGSEVTCLDPVILAEVLNQQFASGAITEAEVQKAFAVFSVAADGGSSSETLSEQPYEKLGTFISNLSPKLRRQFLDSTFGANNKDRQSIAEGILANLTDSVILETLEDIDHNNLSVSPVVLGLLQRLGQNVGSPHNVSEEIDDDNDISGKIKTILREHASEEFVPDDYQRKLNQIIATDQIPRLNMEEVTCLQQTLESRFIESTIGEILINLIREGFETQEERDQLLQSLVDMFDFFLQTGDYSQLHRMIDQLTDGTFPDEIQNRLREEYERREFLEEILDGLSIWGKPRYDDIRSLIHKIGGPFVDVILDRLSEEKKMSLRRFYMDCLIKMGTVTRAPIANRLSDKRWYFLRNLLIVLSAQNDPSVVALIRPLLSSEDPRLRNEVLKTMLHFSDQQAEKQVLEDLDSKSLVLQTAAIQLAERCTTPAITAKLTGMLSQGGYSQIECERKSAIVHALGEIGRVEVLPELAKVLGAWSLINSRQLTKLKTDIVRSLPKYPSKVSHPILRHIANGPGEFARLASDTLKIISGNQA